MFRVTDQLNKTRTLIAQPTVIGFKFTHSHACTDNCNNAAMQDTVYPYWEQLGFTACLWTLQCGQLEQRLEPPTLQLSVDRLLYPLSHSCPTLGSAHWTSHLLTESITLNINQCIHYNDYLAVIQFTTAQNFVFQQNKTKTKHHLS